MDTDKTVSNYYLLYPCINTTNESTAGADASVEALKLYDMIIIIIMISQHILQIHIIRNSIQVYAEG